jgi:signal transduction histidine kinase
LANAVAPERGPAGHTPDATANEVTMIPRLILPDALRLLSLQRALWLSAALLVASVWAFAGYRIWVDHADARRVVVGEARSFARVFEEHVVRTLQLADQAALILKFEYEREGLGFVVADWVRESQKANTIFNLYTIVDERGDVVLSSQEFKPTNLSDREHIAVHVKRDSETLFVGKPVLGRVSRKWSIQLTRRINKADGSFGGVVVVSLDPFYFSRFYGEVDLGRGGSAALIGADGIVRALRTGTEASVGQDLAGDDQFRALATMGTGEFVAPSTFDGVERQFAVRKLTDYPLYVVVGLSTAEAMTRFRESRRDTIAMAALFALVALGSTLVATMLVRRLEASQQAALQSNIAKSTFIANMSHELRTPLNGILGYAELLEGDLSGTEAAGFAKAIHTSGSHLLRLVNDILDMAKIEAGKVELVQENIDLHEVVDGVKATHASAAAKKGIALVVQVDPAVPRQVVADRTKLLRVLNNLVNNAIKFTAVGKIDLVVARSGDNLQFHVRDTGMGIATGHQSRIFERFSQVDASDARSHEGTGLGLALCRELVQLMGGRIWFRSRLGTGSIFSFSIPLVRLSDAGASLADHDVVEPT